MNFRKDRKNGRSKPRPRKVAAVRLRISIFPVHSYRGGAIGWKVRNAYSPERRRAGYMEGMGEKGAVCCDLACRKAITIRGGREGKGTVSWYGRVFKGSFFLLPFILDGGCEKGGREEEKNIAPLVGKKSFPIIFLASALPPSLSFFTLPC